MFGGIIKGLIGEEPEMRQMNIIEAQPQYIQDLIRQIVGDATTIAGDRSNFAPQAPVGLSAGAADVLLPAIESGSFIAGGPGFNFGKRASAMYDTAGQTLQSALPFFQQGGQLITTDQVNTATGEFMNPYEQQVVQGMLGDLQEQASYGDAQIRGQSKAFGGSGMALQRAELQKNLMDTSARQAGNLRYQGYQTAQERAKSLLEGNRAGAFQAGQGIANVGGMQGNLAGSLMGARQTMENIRQQQTEGNLANLRARLTASDMMMTPFRQQSEFEFQERQTPMRQLVTLQSALSGLPLGAESYEDPGRAGLLGGFGDPWAAGANAAKMAIGGAGGLGNMSGFQYGIGGTGGIPWGGFA